MEPMQQQPPTAWPGQQATAWPGPQTPPAWQQQPPVVAPAPPTVEQVQARYAAARAPLVRTAVLWGAIAVVALAISVGTFVNAQSAAADGSGGGSYFVLWGPVIFGGWRAIRAAMGAARISDEARRVGRSGTWLR